jgi:pimeloyl-ACP methyl ester carboxylesterase
MPCSRSSALRCRLLMSEYNPQLTIEGSGPALVLVPGINGGGQLFYRQVPRLRAGYRVATYSLRDDADAMETLVADLHGIVDRVTSPKGRAIIVGESFGGALALTFAFAHPERVEALVILNSFAHFGSQLQLKLARLNILPWSAMRLLRRLTAWRLHSRHTDSSEVERFIQLTADATRRGYLNRLELLRRYDVRLQLGELEAPALFLAAEEDHLLPAVSHARYMAERAPRGTLRILQGHGHICLIAHDLDLSELIDQWRSGSAVVDAM